MKQQKQQKQNDVPAIHSDTSPISNITTAPKSVKNQHQPKEYGGRKDGLDPTRYGDWEKNGRCIDF